MSDEIRIAAREAAKVMLNNRKPIPQTLNLEFVRGYDGPIIVGRLPVKEQT